METQRTNQEGARIERELNCIRGSAARYFMSLAFGLEGKSQRADDTGTRHLRGAPRVIQFASRAHVISIARFAFVPGQGAIRRDADRKCSVVARIQ